MCPVQGPSGADDADAAGQTRHVLTIIQKTLEQAGAHLEDVVRTRMYLTHVEDWECHWPCPRRILRYRSVPRATMIVVAKLLNPAWRIEIEAEAVLPNAEK